MQKWMQDLLDTWRTDVADVTAACNHGNGCRNTVLQASTVHDMFQTHVPATNMFESPLQRPFIDEPLIIDGYGLGWFTGHYRGVS